MQEIELGCFPNKIKEDNILWLLAYTNLEVKLFVPPNEE